MERQPTMTLKNNQLELVRQWFEAVQDTNPRYLEKDDYLTARQIYQSLRRKVPSSIEKQCGK